MEQINRNNTTTMKKELSVETFLFPVLFAAFFALFATQMGLANTINTMINTAYRLLMDTVLYLTAICVLMGAISALFTEFGFVALINRMLQPLMKPVYGMPGAASLGLLNTFLSDNPAILSLADNKDFRRYFKTYQFPALANLSLGMGLIVCSYLMGLPLGDGQSAKKAVAVGAIGAICGSIISTRLMLIFSRKAYDANASLDDQSGTDMSAKSGMRTVRNGSIVSRFVSSILDGGQNGLKMGISIIPGVLIICTIVMMLLRGPGSDGTYTGAAYEGISLLPSIAGKLRFILQPLFGFTSSEAVGVPITALGAAGAAIGLASSLVSQGLAGANDIAVFTAMCMCWSGFLSTQVSLMDSLHCKELTGKSVLCRTIGGLCAGTIAHWLYVIVC